MALWVRPKESQALSKPKAPTRVVEVNKVSLSYLEALGKLYAPLRDEAGQQEGIISPSHTYAPK